MLYNIDINKMNKLMSNNEDARQIIPQLLRNHRNTISTISHEIRNPLTLVSSALQVMEKQNPELKDIPHWSQVMGDVDFIIQLLEELSAFNSSNELYYSVFSIEQLLKNVAISFAISLDTNEADIEFSSSISDSLGEFTGDKIKLQELVLNLLKNAEEAITEQGSIHLAASRSGDIITITCTDTGCGITPEQMECIFQPFVTYKPAEPDLDWHSPARLQRLTKELSLLFPLRRNPLHLPLHFLSRHVPSVIQKHGCQKSTDQPPTWAALSTPVLVKPK